MSVASEKMPPFFRHPTSFEETRRFAVYLKRALLLFVFTSAPAFGQVVQGTLITTEEAQLLRTEIAKLRAQVEEMKASYSKPAPAVAAAPPPSGRAPHNFRVAKAASRSSQKVRSRLMLDTSPFRVRVEVLRGQSPLPLAPAG